MSKINDLEKEIETMKQMIDDQNIIIHRIIEALKKFEPILEKELAKGTIVLG